MSKIKKLSLMICSLLLAVTGFFFVGCGKTDYSNITLTASENNISLDVGEEKSITLQINSFPKNMNGELNIRTLNTSKCVSFEQNYNGDGKTTVTLTGVAGGSTTLTAKAIDGGEECSIYINVKAYSSTFQNNDDKLYVSESYSLTPSSASFKFDASSTERQLRYFFFGRISADDAKPSLDAVTDSEGNYFNEFQQINVIEKDAKYYLLFKQDDKYFTLVDKTFDISKNTFYTFMNVEVIESDGQFIYNFLPDTPTDVAKPVSLGEKLNFFAFYESAYLKDGNLNNIDKYLLLRDFNVLTDIKDVDYSYQYLRFDENYQNAHSFVNDKLILIPNRETEENNGLTYYKSVIFKVVVPGTSELINADYTANSNLNIKLLSKDFNSTNNNTTFTYKVSSNSISSVQFDFNLHVFYTGHENSKDTSVNYQIKVPVVIKSQPSSINVNNYEEGEKTYTFYNNYSGSSIGWQEFKLFVLPSDASYKNAVIKFNKDEILLKYKNNIYSQGELTIEDIYSPIYFKGATTVDQTEKLGKIEITLVYNAIVDEELSYNIDYRIIAGAKSISFENSQYESNGLYLPLDSQSRTFAGLFADASYQNVTFSLLEGEDVVSLSANIENIIGDNQKYPITFDVKSKIYGEGKYKVSLDNGISKEITFKVIETLNDVSMTVDGDSKGVTFIENTAAAEGEIASSLMYVKNSSASEFDGHAKIKLIANANPFSHAITGASYVKQAECLSLTDTVTTTVNANITTKSIGNGFIRYTLSGYTVDENFTRQVKSINYIVYVVSYNLINGLTINKLQDGNGTYQNTSAAYVNIFYNSLTEAKRTAIFDFSTPNSGYLFYNYAESNRQGKDIFQAGSLNKSHIYWTSSETSEVMYYKGDSEDNLFTIPNIGTFNTDTMTFIGYNRPFTLNLVANIRQYDRTYSFTIKIDTTEYQKVQNISVQDYDSEQGLNFSLTKQTIDLIVHITPNNATTQALFIEVSKNSNIEVAGQNPPEKEIKTIYLFGNAKPGEAGSGITIRNIGNGSSIITLSIADFLATASDEVKNSPFEISSTVRIASADWVNGESINDEFLSRAIVIDCHYTNGTKANPYSIENSQDFMNISKNLSAHYKLSTNISLTDSQVQNLPLGAFSGSLIGTNDYAQISGIKIGYKANSNMFGLFTSNSGIIKNIQFTGAINIDSALTAYDLELSKIQNFNVGLIAGVNSGLIQNIGVSIDGKVVKVNQGSFNIGGIVGQNNGQIIIDQTKLVQEYDNHGDAVFNKTFAQDGSLLSYNTINQNNVLTYKSAVDLKVENKITKTWGRTSTSILSNFNSTLVIDATDNSSINVGGVAGLNGLNKTAKIEKIDDEKVAKYGYSNYLTFADIKIQKAVGSSTTSVNAGGVAGLSHGMIFGGQIGKRVDGQIKYFDVNEQTKVVSALYNTSYKIGSGILAGGKVVDLNMEQITSGQDGYKQNIGGIVGNYYYNTGAIDQENGIGNVFFGATSRVNVVGSKNVGGIAGNIDLVVSDEGSDYVGHFALQAVDNGGTGFSSALVTRVGYANNSLPGISNLNDIAFAERNTLDYGFMTNANVLSYVKRSYKDINNSSNRSLVMPSLDAEYAGNYIEVEKGNVNNGEEGNVYYVRNQVKFSDASASLNVTVNSGFSSFESQAKAKKSTTDSEKMFYMYYFKSLGYVYSQTEQDVTKSQETLDKTLNRVLTSSGLYPIILSDDTSITSMNPEILSIDKNGTINVFKTGIAMLSITSILDEKNTINVYLNVLNYFSNKETSIIYPSSASDASPIENSTIELKGQSSVTLYIIPSTTSITENLTADKGIVTIDGNNIQIGKNEEISSYVSIFKSKITYDAAGNITNTDCIYDNSGKFVSGTEELSVNVSGQTITFVRNSSTQEEIRYYLLFSPIIKVRVQENLTDYVCYVNKKLDNVDLTYIKGAESIALKYSEKVISTSTIGQDEIVVKSSKAEESPYYTILRNGKTLFCNLPGLESGLYLIKDENGNFVNNSILNIGLFAGAVTPINSLLSNYSFDVQYSVNKSSQQYLNRYNENIYGDYEIIFYASTNTAKFVSVNVTIERFFVNNISIDNYENIENINDFSGAKNIGVPGKYGLLAITLTPEDCDFDYITIENDAINSLVGNGTANFSLVRKNATGKTEFTEVNISGSITNKGIKLKYEDILNAYNNVDESQNIESYRGVIYIKYVIGTKNVLDESYSKFNVTVSGENETPASASKTLQLKLEYHAYADIVGKTPVGSQEGKVHATYQLARGMKYEISLDDRWGFPLDNITLNSTNQDVGQIIQENGKYYLQITENTIDYNKFETFNIEVKAYQREGELERTFESITKIQVLEYVINYNYDLAGKADIVKEMDGGIINVQIGNIHTFEVDMLRYLEYNHNINSIAEQVEYFMKSLTDLGEWRVYTNLNESGLSNNKVVNTKNYVTTKALLASGNANKISNIYFNSEGNNLSPIATHQAITPFYVFSYKGAFAIEKGIYSFRPFQDVLQSGISNVYTEFAVDVFQGSSAESPIPIDNYADFLKMQNGANYILLKDLKLENQPSVDVNGDTVAAFKPINAKIASLDGNGYTINFEGSYNFDGLDKLGLFGSVDSSSLLKNIKVKINQNTTFITSAAAFEAGIIAGENNGAITNCEVIGGRDANLGEVYYFDARNNDRKSKSYVAGIAGRNAGYITNSRSSANIKSYYNVAGITGVNTSKISSTYFKGGNLICSSQEGHKLSGFVNVNTGENAKIITSYVSGQTSSDAILSLDNKNVLSSSGTQAGFVSANLGTIENCYSNIQMQGSSFMSGFADENSGRIYNCYSTSILENRVTSSFGFARGNKVTEEGQSGGIGTFENCFYIYNIMSQTESETNNNGFDFSIGKDVNSSLASVIFDGVQKIKPIDFKLPTRNDFATPADFNASLAIFNQRFGDFGYSSIISYNSVWFYSTGITSSHFNNTKFNKNRLELASPNMVASSQRNLTKTSIDSTTGAINYQYSFVANSPSQGDLKNPYVIRNAKEFEFYILSAKTTNNYNMKNYRLVSDINYSDYGKLSSMYKIKYCGLLEGNGMKVSNIILLSMENLDSAGMFAEIGKDASAPGTIMNLTIEPKQVAFTNTTSVGTLAGTLNYGYLSNINVTKKDSEVNVVGSNFVGGIIGRTSKWFNVFNLKSDISAIAYYTPEIAGESVETSSYNLNMYSYAGSIMGYASGQNSNIQKIEVSGVTDVMAGRAGIAFGGVGFGVSVDDVSVKVSSNVSIIAHFYGGLVAGENRGALNNVYVKGTGSVISPFALVPKTPIAVAGVVGNMQSGKLSNVYMGQAFRVGTDSGSRSVGYVGGIVGATSTSNLVIEKALVDANIQAPSTLGGIIGYNNAITTLNEVAVKSMSLSVTGYTYSACVGGIVGKNISSSLTITNSYCTSKIAINIWGYSSAISSAAGGFVGDGKVLKMQNCFATSFVDVSMIDKRESGAVDNLINFVNREVDENETDNRDAYKFENENSITGCQDVYYLGFNGSSAKDGENAIKHGQYFNVQGLGNKNVSESIKFKHNAIGLSSYEYAKDKKMNNNVASNESLSVILKNWVMTNSYRNSETLSLDKSNTLNGLFDFYTTSRTDGSKTVIEKLFFSKVINKQDPNQCDRYVVYDTNNLDNNGKPTFKYKYYGFKGGLYFANDGTNWMDGLEGRPDIKLNFNDPTASNYVVKDTSVWIGGKDILPSLSFEKVLLQKVNR